MKKLKDFFYDKNDIFIVLVIVAVAAFVIYISIDSIMGYPEQYAKDVAATETKETATIAETSTEDASTTAANVSITIEDSDGSSDVAAKLQEAGLVDSAEDFDSYVTEQGKSGSISSGTFQIPTGSSYEEILNIIT